MKVDGNKIAKEIYHEIADTVDSLGHQPTLGIVTCAPNFATRSYLSLKQRKAAAVGIGTEIVELSDSSDTKDVLRAVAQLATEGVIVQLPLPQHIDRDAVLAAVPPGRDVDALNPETTEVLSPVVEACKEILSRAHISPAEKQVVVLGSGRLVGAPVAEWLRGEGASVTTFDKDARDIADATRAADIVVCGTGSPGFLKPDMVKDGVVIIDAGTSESEGKLAGDADPACADKAVLFTPVPGGVGPITIAALLRNLIRLAAKE